jgi:hypothetical protein
MLLRALRLNSNLAVGVMSDKADLLGVEVDGGVMEGPNT